MAVAPTSPFFARERPDNDQYGGPRRLRQVRPCSKACARWAPAACCRTCWRSCSTRRSKCPAPNAGSHAGRAGERPRVQAGAGARERTLPDATFATSRKIPEEVFRTGVHEGRRRSDGRRDGRRAPWARSRSAFATWCACRSTTCTTSNRPRRAAKIGASACCTSTAASAASLSTDSTRAALETLAAEAVGRHRERAAVSGALEKAKMEQEMRIAAEIQQALLPQAARESGLRRGRGGQRAVPVDRRRLLRLSRRSRLGVRVHARRRGGQGAAGGAAERADAGHVRRPYADSLASRPTSVSHVNKALCRRGIESRFVTIMLGRPVADGRPDLLQRRPQPAVRDREVAAFGGSKTGGPVIGLLEFAPFEQETVQLEPGDVVVVFSDGVSEAMSSRRRGVRRRSVAGRDRRRAARDTGTAWSSASWPPCARSPRARRRATTSRRWSRDRRTSGHRHWRRCSYGVSLQWCAGLLSRRGWSLP